MAGRTRPGFGRDGWRRPGSSKINDSSTKPGQRAMVGDGKGHNEQKRAISRSTNAALVEGRRLKYLISPRLVPESSQNALILFSESELSGVQARVGSTSPTKCIYLAGAHGRAIGCRPSGGCRSGCPQASLAIEAILAGAVSAFDWLSHRLETCSARTLRCHPGWSMPTFFCCLARVAEPCFDGPYRQRRSGPPWSNGHGQTILLHELTARRERPSSSQFLRLRRSANVTLA